MAEELFDKGEPRSNLIFGLAVFAIGSLGLSAWGFTSLFNSTVAQNNQNVLVGNVIGDETAGEQAALNPLTHRAEVRRTQEAQLNQGRVPIARALQLYGQRGRGASPAIMPRQSDDTVGGWERLHDSVDNAAAGPGDESASNASGGDAVEAGDTAREEAANIGDGETPQDVTDAEEQAQAAADSAEEAVGEQPTAGDTEGNQE